MPMNNSPLHSKIPHRKKGIDHRPQRFLHNTAQTLPYLLHLTQLLLSIHSLTSVDLPFHFAPNVRYRVFCLSSFFYFFCPLVLGAISYINQIGDVRVNIEVTQINLKGLGTHIWTQSMKFFSRLFRVQWLIFIELKVTHFLTVGNIGDGWQMGQHLLSHILFQLTWR